MRYRLTAAENASVPSVISIGYSSDPTVTRFGPCIRNQYIIHYVISGRGTFNGNTVNSGEGFIITPGMLEEYHPDPKDPWGFLWVISEDPSMDLYISRHNANSQTNIFKFKNLQKACDVAQLIMSSKSSFSQTSVTSELFLSIYNGCITSRIEKTRSSISQYFDYSVNYIRSNVHTHITVEKLCSLIGVSQPYLYRVFKECSGMSPKQYISKCKLDTAKALLTHADITVTEISVSVGFDDVLAFSKFFSSQTGQSPSAFKKNVSSDN